MTMDALSARVWGRASQNPANEKFDKGDRVQISPTGKECSDNFPECKGEVVGFKHNDLMVKIEWENGDKGTYNPSFVEHTEEL